MEFTAQSRQVRRRHATMGKAVPDATERAVFLFRAKQEKIIAMRFFEFVRQCQAPDVLRDFRRFYEQKDYQKILKLTEDQLIDFSLVSPKVVLSSAIWENEKLRESLDVKVKKLDIDPSLDISFDIGDPEAARLLRQSALEFIREITEAQRDIIRATIAQALEQGLSPTDAARLFRRNIGLTTFQMSAVNNYRRALESGNRSALDRVLRDRRFDSSVNNALNRNIQLSASQIERMVDRYHSRMLDMRAETIARTEGLSAVNSGRHEAMNQMMDKLDLEEARIERKWRCAMDGRQRDTHGGMNGQIRGAKEPFLSSSGAKLMYPGDRSAPAAEVINCRCVPLIRIKEPHEMIAAIDETPGLQQIVIDDRARAATRLAWQPTVSTFSDKLANDIARSRDLFTDAALGAFDDMARQMQATIQAAVEGVAEEASKRLALALAHARRLEALAPGNQTKQYTQWVAQAGKRHRVTAAILRDQIDLDILEAYARARARNPDETWVYLEDLRRELGTKYSRAEVDAALRRLWQEGARQERRAIDLAIQDDQGALTDARRSASTRFGSSRQDMISISDSSPLAIESKPVTTSIPDVLSAPTKPIEFTQEQHLFRAAWSPTYDSFYNSITYDTRVAQTFVGETKVIYDKLVLAEREVMNAIDVGDRASAVASLKEAYKQALALEEITDNAGGARLYTQWIHSAIRRHQIKFESPE